MTPKEFFDFAKEHKAETVDLKFTDLLGPGSIARSP